MERLVPASQDHTMGSQEPVSTAGIPLIKITESSSTQAVSCGRVPMKDGTSNDEASTVTGSSTVATDQTHDELSDSHGSAPFGPEEDDEGGDHEAFYPPLNPESRGDAPLYACSTSNKIISILLLNSPPPLATRERVPWMRLLKPDMGAIEQRLERSRKSTSHVNITTTRREHDVTFDMVIIRSYSQTVGDNPAVSYGPPIQLDWRYEEQLPIAIDEYEGSRGKRRVPRRFILNHYERFNILSYYCGFSDTEINDAQREADKIKRERRFTKILSHAGVVEAFLGSAARKTKRLIKCGRR
jgi:hypothetical protein